MGLSTLSMRLFTFLLLFLTAAITQGQTPRFAQTLDAQTRRPLPGVTVSTGGQPRTASDAAGRFSLDADSVSLSALGYQPLTVRLSTDSTANLFFLQPTAVELDEIIVRAYESDRRLSEVPAAVATLGPRELGRFAGVSLVPALNTLPGVRMEERSPGSYRLSIRGSTLRSPFGVRNVKVYFNGLPFTDAGGNTYLQAFDFQSISRLEIIKGPGGSLYGAGTGGVVLLESPRLAAGHSRLSLGTTVGSFGLRSFNAQAETATEGAHSTLSYSVTSADGYREQSALRREVLSVQSGFSVGKQRFNNTVLYSDLYYQTPGGLTRAQFEANPRQARPRGGPNPGAVEQGAEFRIKTLYLATSQDWAIAPRLSLRSGVYGTFTQVQNPAIRNWERRAEQGVGGRFTGSYSLGSETVGGKLTAGVEFQQGFFNVKNYGNRRGAVDTVQLDEEITYAPWSLFAQLETWLGRGWSLTGGLSYNGLTLTDERLFRPATPRQRRRFDPVLSPRLAFLKKLSPGLSAYASLSSGFSPPTVAEVLPSTGAFNTSLAPERGTSYEAGLRGSFAKNRLTYDLTAYAFRLKNALVIRRAADGAEFFTNAGDTRQNGVEASVAYNHKLQTTNLKLFSTYAFQDYYFGSFVGSAGDFSGNRLTGTPRHQLTLGADLVTQPGFYTNLTFNYTDEVPLNDANSDAAPGYRLLGGKVGYQKKWGKFLELNAYAGIDNALDATYTPAPDLNAVGGRYFNAAAGRNWYGGVRVGVLW